MAEVRAYAEGVEINAPIPDEFAEILTPEAVAFVAKLSREFGGRVDEILEKRKEFQQRIDAGEMPDFLSETKDVREGDWRVKPAPADLLEACGSCQAPLLALFLESRGLPFRHQLPCRRASVSGFG